MSTKNTDSEFGGRDGGAVWNKDLVEVWAGKCKECTCFITRRHILKWKGKQLKIRASLFTKCSVCKQNETNDPAVKFDNCHSEEYDIGNNISENYK